MTNRYEGKCHYCGEAVPAGEGSLWRWKGRWYVAHRECSKARRRAKRAGRSKSVYAYFPGSGETVFVNRNGRCEDAPCCGCCS